jgi:hypothetical protein
MGGGEKEKANQMADDQYRVQQTDKSAFQGTLDKERPAAQNHADDLYGTMSSGYKSLLDPSGTMTSLFPNGVGGGGARQVAPQYTRDKNFDVALGDYRDFAKTGGIDPSRTASIDETIGNLKQFGKTGGLDEAAMQRMQGNGYYDEFAKTGGLSDADKANYRARSTSVIPSLYGQLKDQANRAGMVQGGYGPGTTAMQSRLARQNAGALSDATRGAEADIADRVQQGRQFGVTGMSSTAQAANALRTGNQLAGMSGAGALDMNLANSIQSGREFGTSGTQSIAESNQSFADKQQAADAAAANANSSGSSADAKWAAEFGLNSKLAGLGGLGSLYTSLPAELNNNDQMNLANRGLAGGLSNETVGQKLSNNKSGWDQFGSIAGSIGGAAAGGLAGAFTNLPKKKPAVVQAGS